MYLCQIYIQQNIFDKYTSTVFLPVVKMATSQYNTNTNLIRSQRLDNIYIKNKDNFVQKRATTITIFRMK